jgi:hypothetical protein
LIGSPINNANRLIGSSITSQSTGTGTYSITLRSGVTAVPSSGVLSLKP